MSKPPRIPVAEGRTILPCYCLNSIYCYENKNIYYKVKIVLSGCIILNPGDVAGSESDDEAELKAKYTVEHSVHHSHYI